MDFTGEEKIIKLEAEIAEARTPKQKCNLIIDLAMELRHSNPGASLQDELTSYLKSSSPYPRIQG